jgi:hypothetical protein
MRNGCQKNEMRLARYRTAAPALHGVSNRWRRGVRAPVFAEFVDVNRRGLLATAFALVACPCPAISAATGKSAKIAVVAQCGTSRSRRYACARIDARLEANPGPEVAWLTTSANLKNSFAIRLAGRREIRRLRLQAVIGCVTVNAFEQLPRTSTAARSTTRKCLIEVARHCDPRAARYGMGRTSHGLAEVECAAS